MFSFVAWLVLADTSKNIILLCVLPGVSLTPFGDNWWFNQVSGSDFCTDSQVPPNKSTSASPSADADTIA
jgi:hypothetical protein